MGLILLIQTINISLITGISTYSFWFSYILFLIFLGGILVLFIYVSSLASNEPFSFSIINFLLFLFILGASFIVLTLVDFTSIPSALSAPSSSISEIYSTSIIIRWIYSKNLMSFTLFIINYLLLTLVVVVKITNLFKGPLRLST